MRGVVMYTAGDVRVEEREDPKIIEPADHQVMGHEYVGIVEEIGSEVKNVKVGDGAVGLMAVLAARQLGAERIIAMSRHPERQKLARFHGATDIVEERGNGGVVKIKELTIGCAQTSCG